MLSAGQPGVPVFVDAAGGIPPIGNIRRYPSMGVDLYGFSGGKGLRGPQDSGLLLGRRDLIEAAPGQRQSGRGAVCRAMKVSKDQIVGCMAALEKWLTVDLEALYREQTETLERIEQMVKVVPGVETEIEVRRGSNRFMQMVVRWDEEAFGLTADECGRLLREGDTPISVAVELQPVRGRGSASSSLRGRQGAPGQPPHRVRPQPQAGGGTDRRERLRDVLQWARNKGAGNG